MNAYRLVKFGSRPKVSRRIDILASVTVGMLAGGIFGGLLYLICTHFIETIFVLIGISGVVFCIRVAVFIIREIFGC